MITSKLRASFLEFFAAKGHTIVKSASLVPHNDPSLLFTTAGMVQFKDIFTGKQSRPYPSAVSSQKCLRAGGKHNDLEQVGHTKRHHTFFEMLGNFSFGDYFKEQAIAYAWEFCTEYLGLDKEKLWVTVYHTDDEAFALWRKIAELPEHRIIRISTQDNFWSAGDTGPCGPCSEIFYDHGETVPGGPPGSADADGDRFVELWNIVFMELEQTAPGVYKPLERPSIDTGMGIERMAAVLQGVCDNFETDIFRAIIKHSKDISSAIAQHYDVSHRVIADHIRSIAFLIADGVLPSNEGRGYVLRRIIRRALRHVHQIGAPYTHLVHLVPILVDKMGDFYQELIPAQALIDSVLIQEGERFKDLLDQGLELLSQWMCKGVKSPIFPGKNAFQLYDTYGFPLDLTQDILRDHGIRVDEAEFNFHMEQQRKQSRQSWTGSGVAVDNHMWIGLSETLPQIKFTGYTENTSTGNILSCIYRESGTDQLKHEQGGYIITDITPFYGKSGGQVGDIGWIINDHGRAEVLDTKKHGNLIVHKVIMREGILRIGDSVILQVDAKRRQGIKANHTVTHLLQAALRTILGQHVVQKGSLVSESKIRFDFSHYQSITWEQCVQIENLVNQYIRSDTSVSVEIKSHAEAVQEGAMALFGEKYDSQVRVVSIDSVSKELCGGTHVNFTGEVGLFKITCESSVASGIRRIEAVVGAEALALFQGLDWQIKMLSAQLKATPDQLEDKIRQLMEKKSEIKNDTVDLDVTKEKIKSIDFWYAHSEDIHPKLLRGAMDQLKQEIGSGIIAISSTLENKLTALVGVTKDLTSKWDASAMLSKALKNKGSSGGRADFAQGGGIDITAPDAIVKDIQDMLKSEPAINLHTL